MPALRDAASFFAHVGEGVAQAAPAGWSVARLDATTWSARRASAELLFVVGAEPLDLVIVHDNDDPPPGERGPFTCDHLDLATIHLASSFVPPRSLAEILRPIIATRRPLPRRPGAWSHGAGPYRSAGARVPEEDAGAFYTRVDEAVRHAAPTGWAVHHLDAQNWSVVEPSKGVIEHGYEVRANGSPRSVLIEHGNSDAGPIRVAPYYASYLDAGGMPAEEIARALAWVFARRPCNAYGYS